MAVCVYAEPTETALDEAAQFIEGSPNLTTEELALALPEPASNPTATFSLRDGSSVVVDPAGGQWTLIRPDAFTVSRPIRPLVRLRYATFDPLEGEPVIDPALAAADTSLRIVQFWTDALEQYEADLRAAGAHIYKYLPDQCLIVHADHDAARALAAHPAVRWIGPYQPAYRLDPALAPFLVAGADAQSRFNIQVFQRGLAHKQEVAQYLRSIGADVAPLTPSGFLLTAALTPNQLLSVLHRDEVHFVDRWAPRSVDMDIARRVSWADGLERFTGLTGQGVRAEVMDGNLRTSHADFQDPPPLIHGPIAGDQTHGTRVYGIVFSRGVSTAAARGLLPEAEQHIFADFGQLVDRYAHTAELVDPDGPYRAAFQSNSWGTGTTTDYTTVSMELDDIAFINDLTMLHSQSNSGNRSSRPEAWAKNVVSIGAILHNDNIDPSDDCWCGAASIGPAADGRIKPDLSHFGDWITTSDRSNDTDFTTAFGGTSAATPITAGYLGLILQMWHEGFYPGHGRRDSVFESRPHMTTAKALMINSARQYDFRGVDDDLSRFHQGWGLINVRDAFEHTERALVIDESDVLQPFGSVRYDVRVREGTPEFRATMTFADPPGNTAAAVHRINDLDLLVLSPDGAVYWGNHGLSDGPYSRPAGQPDTVNTVENVIIREPTPGAWTVLVSAVQVNEDGHPETTERDVDFALVVSGIAGLACPADWNRDGVIDVNDVLDFLTDWFEGKPDLTGDGSVNLQDLLAYLAHFFQGCPES